MKMINRLFTLATSGRYALKMMLIISVFSAVLQGLCFALLMPFLDALLHVNHAAGEWLAAMAFMVGVALGSHYLAQRYAYRAGIAIARDLWLQLSEHLRILPLGWFNSGRAGEIGALCSQNVVSVMGLPAHLLYPLIVTVVTPVTMIGVMVFICYPLALLALICVPLLWGIFRWSGNLVSRSGQRYQQAIEQLNARVIEFTQLQPVLRIFDEGAGRALLRNAFREQHISLRGLIVTAVPGMVTFALAVQGVFTLLLIGGGLFVLHGMASVTEFVALVLLIVRFVEPMMTLADLGAGLRMADGALIKLHQLLTASPLPAPEQVTNRPDSAEIRFEKVHFSYDNRPVLHDIDLVIPHGSLTALVGPSGAGKSTLLRLMTRFYDVDSGRITLGGVDVRQLPEPFLLQQFSFMFQQVWLFDDTIMENIRIGQPDASDADIYQAGKWAGVDEIARRIQHGWHGRVGARGQALSGGERQRVALARSLLKNAPIMLFDEATSALDAVNQRKIQMLITSLRGKCTQVIITHRLHTIMDADQIVVLDDSGGIAAIGQHETLLHESLFYQQFWQLHAAEHGWGV